MTFVFPSINGRKPEKRMGHVAVHYDGYLVVWGGYYRELYGVPFIVDKMHNSNEVWLYCIETSTWKQIETSGEEPPPMSGSSACVMEGKSMYIFAGHCDGGPTSTVFVLDLKTFIWENLTSRIQGNPPSPRDKLCCWTHNDLILYFGGYGLAPDPERVDQSNGYFTFDSSGEEHTDNTGWNSHLFVLDTSSLTWIQPKTKGRPPSPRAAQASAQIANMAYLFGGRYMERRRNDLHSLNMDTLEWSGSISTMGNVPQGRSWHSLSPVSDKHLFLYGGYNNDQDVLGDAYILATSTMTWFQLTVPSNPSSPMTRNWHTACCTSLPGEVVIFGGKTSFTLFGDDPYLASILIFRFTPPRLNWLCADAIVNKYYSTISKQLKSLPKNLLASLFLHRRLKALGKI
ncbi:unnamed protein product [Porites evermanni]|uniref:Kelch domain-containing protein 2 n=1 Tax=Porites evermanni TaxID=104178 RepID=A0ABN8NAI7_9CNID|nr:unnamed protein product [Porites evermanni]